MLPADKVVPKAGLVVCVYDILDIQGGFVYPSDGAAIYDVTFRLVVFLPFIGEVIVGRLASSSKWVTIASLRQWQTNLHGPCVGGASAVIALLSPVLNSSSC